MPDFIQIDEPKEEDPHPTPEVHSTKQDQGGAQ